MTAVNCLRLCRGCLSSNDRLFELNQDQLQDNFFKFNISNKQSQLLPPWLCWQCYSHFNKYMNFRKFCKETTILLDDYLSKHSNFSVQGVSDALHRGPHVKLSNKQVNCMNFPPNIINIETLPTIKKELESSVEIDTDLITNKINYSTERLHIKTETMDENYCNENFIDCNNDVFNSSDDEPIVKSKEKKQNVFKVKHIKRKHKNERKQNILTPSKNFDSSSTILRHLSKEEQLQELESHRRSVKYIKSPYKCEKCVKGFSHEIVYKHHCIKHELVSGNYVCELCTQRFNTWRNYNNHLNTHTLRYTCRLCNKTLISKQNIMSHMFAEHDETNSPVKCDICDRVYKNRCTYSKHMRIHKNTEEYKCNLCLKSFLWKDNYNRHLSTHKKERPIKCDICSKSFIVYQKLKEHLLVHDTDKKFYCAQCDLSYASQIKLNQHLKRGSRHIQPEQLTFSCEFCQERYSNNRQLEVHISHHHLNKRAYTCDTCNSGFFSKMTLKNHIKNVHEGYKRPRKHVCETCGKQFTEKHILRSHIRTHTGEKPYTCTHCGAQFAQNGALYTHVKLLHLKKNKLNQNRKENIELNKSIDEELIEKSVPIVVNKVKAEK